MKRKRKRKNYMKLDAAEEANPFAMFSLPNTTTSQG